MKTNVAAQGRLRGSLTPHLTPREREIMQLVCNGLTNRSIAGQLSISLGTVTAHLGRIYERIGIEDRAQLLSQGPYILGATETTL